MGDQHTLMDARKVTTVLSSFRARLTCVGLASISIAVERINASQTRALLIERRFPREASVNHIDTIHRANEPIAGTSMRDASLANGYWHVAFPFYSLKIWCPARRTVRGDKRDLFRWLDSVALFHHQRENLLLSAWVCSVWPCQWWTRVNASRIGKVVRSKINHDYVFHINDVTEVGDVEGEEEDGD